MSTIVGTNYLTLADLAKREFGENDKETSIIDLLSQTNTLLEDANVVECNNGTSHKSVIRTGLPSATWRKLYGGVAPSKSTTAQVTDSCGMLEAYSEVDKDIADMAKAKEQFLLDEASAFLEAMNQECQDNIFYGNLGTSPEKFDGLAVRFGNISESKTNIGYNVISAGGAGDDNTSIWMVTWGNLHTSLLYPRGSKAGLQHENKGQDTKTLADGSMFEVYRSHFKWNVGLTVRDWRSTCRIANIDASALAAGSTIIEDYLITGFYRINRFNKSGKTVIYANQETLTALHKRAKDKANVNLTIGEFGGAEIVKFLGLPIKCSDQILNTQELVTAAA